MNVLLKEPSACWLWGGNVNRGGYGKFKLNGKMVYAHRFSYEYANGKIPDGSVIFHNCDFPNCVNPSHLFVGSHQDNIRDKVEKQRHSRGSTHGRLKLMESNVLVIRESTETNVVFGGEIRRVSIGDQ